MLVIDKKENTKVPVNEKSGALTIRGLMLYRSIKTQTTADTISNTRRRIDRRLFGTISGFKMRINKKK